MDSKQIVTPRETPKRLLAGLILLLPLILFSVLAWHSLLAAVLVPEKSVFLLPLLWFSLLSICFGLVSILVIRWWLRLIASILLVLPSLFFAFELWHAVFVVAGVGFAYLATGSMGRALSERLKISFRKSLSSGLILAVLGLSIVLSSQYYVHAQKLSWENLVPSFDLGEGTGAWIIRVFGPLYPPLKSLEDEQVTVDTFFRELRTNQKRPTDEWSLDLNELLREQGITPNASLDGAIQEKLQEKDRESISRLLGREVAGEEKMSGVLSEVMRKKALAFVSGTNENKNLPVPVIPFVLSVLLFLSVYPVGAFLAPFWALFASFLLLALVRSRILSIVKIPTEQERLE